MATISRSAPTVNVATIDSDQTEPHNGQDSVTVSVTAPPLAGNPTPTRSPAGGQVPNTAMGPIGGAPTVLIALVLLGSLGGLAWTNLARTSRRRR